MQPAQGPSQRTPSRLPWGSTWNAHQTIDFTESQFQNGIEGIIFLRGQQLADALNEHEAANIALRSGS